MFIRLTFFVCFLLLTFARPYALSSTLDTASLEKATNSTQIFATDQADLSLAAKCVQKIAESGSVVKCNKHAEEMLKKKLVPFEWVKAIKGVPVLKKKLNVKDCHGLYVMIRCGVTESCTICSLNESLALETFGKNQIQVIQANFCQEFTQPLNVSVYWCDSYFNDGMTFVLIMILGMAALLLLGCGMVIYNVHADRTVMKNRKQRKVKSKSKSKTFSLKARSAGRKSRLAKSNSSKAKRSKLKVKSPIAEDKSRMKRSVAGVKSFLNKSPV